MAYFLLVGLTFFVITAVARGDSIHYGVVGGNLILKPPPGSSTQINNVLWKHNGNYAAEWSTGDADVTTYRNFKGRVELDKTNGYITIKNLSAGEAGSYSVEINSVTLQDKYEIKLISKPPKPEVWVRPDGTNIELVCDGDVTNANPVTYFWALSGDDSFVERERIVVLPNNETTQAIETFSCKITNPVGESTSEPKENPFSSKKTNEQKKEGGSDSLWALVLLPIGVIAFLVWWFRDKIKQRLSGNAATVPTSEQPENAVPLKT